MSKPQAGATYIVQAGDTFEGIAAQAYGDPKLSARIIKANQSQITSLVPVPGQSIIIPRLPETEHARIENISKRIKGKESDELTVVVDGIELPVMAVHIYTAMDAIADGFSIQIAWIPGQMPLIDERLLPYSYRDAAIYIGSELIVNGVIYGISSSLNRDGSTKLIEVWTQTADLVDSNLKPPYEESSITLRQRAESLVTAMGLTVVYELDTDEFFDRVTAKSSDTIFGHLVQLAGQRGVLMTCNPVGDVVFTEVATDAPVGTLEETTPIVTEWESVHDGRQRFNVYRVIGQSPGDNARSAIATDPRIPKSRFKTFRLNETTDGNIQAAADWRMTKQIADAMSLTLPVSSWFAPNGELWRKNSLVTVISPVLHVAKGFTFLIRRVEFVYGNDGRSAILHLTPPQVYSHEPIVEPWS